MIIHTRNKENELNRRFYNGNIDKYLNDDNVVRVELDKIKLDKIISRSGSQRMTIIISNPDHSTVTIETMFLDYCQQNQVHSTILFL